MGKTFRSNGYMEHHRSFNGLRKHKRAKINRRRQKRLYVSQLAYHETHDTPWLKVKHIKHLCSKRKILMTDKIGYVPNSCLNVKDLFDQMTWLLAKDRSLSIYEINILTSLNRRIITKNDSKINMYPVDYTAKCKTKSKIYDMCEEFDKMLLMDKFLKGAPLDYLHLKGSHQYPYQLRNDFIQHIQKMKKQIKRRGTLGYFKGHDHAINPKMEYLDETTPTS